MVTGPERGSDGDAVQKRYSHRDLEALGNNKNIGETSLLDPGIESVPQNLPIWRSTTELSQLICSFRPEQSFQ
jgi:hypothetical protein